ncbi:MAG: acyltransferase family protein [Muribaculaceae bacterium]|nr:acyltransferase family protein [Muribaculaceae bacterium]
MKQTNRGSRNVYMDFLKGLAMVAVVVGHSVSDIPQGSVLFNLIYSFHMPLLMFISAYVEEQNREKYLTQEWRMPLKRATGLLLPYFSWIILYRIIGGNLWNMNIKGIGLELLGYKQSGMWFFPVLFGLKVLHCLYWFIQKKSGRHTFVKDIVICCLLEILVIFLAVLTRHPYIINMLSYAIPYFFAVIIVDNTIVQKIVNSEWMAAGAMVVYIMLFPVFSFHDTHWTTQVIRIGLSLCVIIVCCKFQGKWEINPVNKIICSFGKGSLAIYVLHGFFLDYIPYISAVESSFFLAVLSIAAAFVISGVCIVIAKIIGVSAWWSKILLGK